MREVADYVDNLAAKLEDLAQRRGGPQALTVALRQPIPDPVDCGNCNEEKSARGHCRDTDGGGVRRSALSSRCRRFRLHVAPQPPRSS